jgi:hypothetical protein
MRAIVFSFVVFGCLNYKRDADIAHFTFFDVRLQPFLLQNFYDLIIPKNEFVGLKYRIV